MPTWQRALGGIAGLLLMAPGTTASLTGLAIAAPVLLVQILVARGLRAA